MSKMRLFMVSVLAVFMVGAVASVSSAHEWLEGGVPITTTLSVLSEGGLFRLQVGSPTPTQEIHCTTVRGFGLVLTGGRDFAHEIHFLNCKTAAANCDVHTSGDPNGLVTVRNIATLLVLRENTVSKTKVVADEFKPNGGTTNFVTLQFSELVAGACSAYGTETTVKGQVAAEINNAAHTLEFTNPELAGNSLTAFGKAAKFFGTTEQMYSNGNPITAN